jgi:hypothetical protein
MSDFSTYRKHGMDYFTEQGVSLRTKFDNKKEWYLLCIREILDNSVDFLTKYYKGADNCVIATTISRDEKYFHIKVRNTNYKNIPVLQNKKSILDFDMRYGSKQYLYIISRGMLGDALKQILAFGYILIHLHDDGSSFKDQQWDKPLIVQHNGKEFKIYLTVDKTRQTWNVDIKESNTKLSYTDTEIEVTLPKIDEVKDNLSNATITDFSRQYSVFTTDITFKFNICEDGSKTSLEYKALHHISSESWENQNSCHAYMPEEFKARFVNMDPEEAARTRVYDLLTTWREGTTLPMREGKSLPKKPEYEISIAELCELPDKERDKRIEGYYIQLRKNMNPPYKLSLPYTTNTVKRKAILINRLRTIYSNLEKDPKRAVYKSVLEIYEDQKRGISFPYFFEILAIPFDDPRTAKAGIEYIGAVNYSISPKENSNLFNGNYDNYYLYYNDEGERIHNIRDVLSANGFTRYPIDTSKIPCLIVANLVTPRRDPHGYDKSGIDINPFVGSIVSAVRRLAPDISSYRARGLYFKKPDERKNTDPNTSKRGALGRMLIEYLQANHGLPKIAANGTTIDDIGSEDEEIDESDDGEEDE